MTTTNRQQVRVHYTHRPALGASEVPIAVPDELESASYEMFDASIALIESVEGGEITIRSGAVVLCDATNLGTVIGFLLDTSNGAISHLLLQHVAPASPSEEIVAVSEITGCEADKIYLRGINRTKKIDIIAGGKG
jgi:hypothetical protein